MSEGAGEMQDRRKAGGLKRIPSAAENPAMNPDSRSGGSGLFASAERLLRDAPRSLEVLCAVPLVLFAGSILYGVVVYLRFQQYYGRNLGEKTLDRVTMTVEALIALALIALAFDLLRGESRRRDGGLFAPAALRFWGVVFVVLPFLLLLLDRSVALHPHLFLGAWSAAAACWVLAARRRAPEEPAGRPRPIE